MTALDPIKTRSLFEQRRTAWLAEDVAGYLACWSDDLLIELPGQPEPTRGKSAYAEIVEGSFARTRPIAWTYHHLAIDDEYVLSEWTIEAALRASHRPIAWRGMAACRIDADLITEWREYWDPAVLRDQLG